MNFGKKIKRTVFQWTGIPVSVGISQTKTLAKVANLLFAKRYSAFQGSLCLLDDERITKALAKTPSLKFGNWKAICRHVFKTA